MVGEPAMVALVTGLRKAMRSISPWCNQAREC